MILNSHDKYRTHDLGAAKLNMASYLDVDDRVDSEGKKVVSPTSGKTWSGKLLPTIGQHPQ